ncbi:MAG: hypothetical protein RLZZ591_1740 [Pseudomonadota bacterium]|jgi:uncharacterized protein (DUF4415 family)
MSKKPNPERIDSDNPEWTEEMFVQAKRISDLPASLQSKLRGRGPQKAPPKVSTTIRLSPDVVQAFRAAGDGWQTRIDAALNDWLRTH